MITRVMITFTDAELVRWLWGKAGVERRDVRQQIMIILEQAKAAEDKQKEGE